LEKQLGTKARK